MSDAEWLKYVERIRRVQRNGLPAPCPVDQRVLSEVRRALGENLKSARGRRPGSVTLDDLMEMFIKQGGRCAVSGVKMTWNNGKQGGRWRPTSLSVDRVDPDKDYERDNLRLVCNQANTMKGKMTDAEWFRWMDLAYPWRRKEERRREREAARRAERRAEREAKRRRDRLSRTRPRPAAARARAAFRQRWQAAALPTWPARRASARGTSPGRTLHQARQACGR